MSKEIKMSDVFNLPVKEQKIEIYGVDCKPDFTLEEIECYAAYAINNHNRLTEENKRLREFVKLVSELDIETFNFETADGDEDYFEYVCPDICEDACELLEELEKGNERLC